MQRIILTAILCLSSGTGIAQVAPAERNATEQEIAGDWQLVPLPSALQPPFIKNDPWPAKCQWYSYSGNGELKSINKLREPCDTANAAQLDQAFREVPAVMSWKYVMNTEYQKPAIFVTRSDVKKYLEIWEQHIVATPFVKGGVEFAQGDLLLYLANLQTHQRV